VWKEAEQVKRDPIKIEYTHLGDGRTRVESYRKDEGRWRCISSLVLPKGDACLMIRVMKSADPEGRIIWQEILRDWSKREDP